MPKDFGLGWAQEQYDAQNPPEEETVATCAYCGRDICKGEKIYKLDDDVYCCDCITEDEAKEDEPPDEY